MSRKKNIQRRKRRQNKPLPPAATPVENEKSLSGKQAALYIRSEQKEFIGPIPPAEELAKYDPDTRAWIRDRATKQHDHQISLETKSTDAAVAAVPRGQWFSFIFFLALLGVVGFGVIPTAERFLTNGLYILVAVFGFDRAPKWIANWRALFRKEDEPPP